MRPIVPALIAASLLFVAVLTAFIFLGPTTRREAGTEAGAALPGPVQPGAVRGAEAERAPFEKRETPPKPAAVLPAASPAPGPREEPADPPRGNPSIPRGDASLFFELSDAAGRPFPDASVKLQRGRSAASVACDSLGAAAFTEISPGTYTFRVVGAQLPELVSARELSVSPGEVKHVPLTIEAYTLSIAGRVLDRQGQPVEGIIVRARRQLFQAAEGELLRADQENLESRSDRQGRYEIRGLNATDFLVRTEATGEYPSASRVYRAGSLSADIILEESRMLGVHGIVTARDGHPIEGARVLPLGQISRQVESDASGLYQLEVEITEGQALQIITVSKEGYREARMNVHTEETRTDGGLELNLTLDALGASAPVSGVVLDRDHRPVVGETVYLHSASMNARYQAVSDAQGRFQLSGAQVGGDYRLWIYPKQGFRDFQRMPVEVPEQGAEIECVLEPVILGKLRGAMVDPNGAPVPSFTLWLKGLKALGSSIPITGGTGGVFEADDVPEGELLFETRSLPRLTVRGIQFDPAGGAEARLVLDWGPLALGGSVTDEGGLPVPGANVSLYWSHKVEPSGQSSSFRSSVTDERGRFSFTELGPGEHKISVSSGSHAPGQALYDVGGGVAEPVIRLKAKPARDAR